MDIKNIRVIVFGSLLFVFFILELVKPRRKIRYSKWKRGFSNISVILIDNLIVFFLVPIVPITIAEISKEKSIGLFNLLELPFFLEIIISILVLDLVIYFQHRFFHKATILWKIHRMHHIDPELDATSGFRFHPIEIIISSGIKVGSIALIGIPAIAVVFFEIILNGCAMFNHSNIKIPVKIDKAIRRFLITPDMHRVHHSVYLDETNSNYGFSIPLWDFIFKSYRDQPRDGHDKMKIGIKKMPKNKFLYFPAMLVDPFVN